MNFSELLKQTNQLCRISPDGNHLAAVIQQRLIVRELPVLHIVHSFACQEQVQVLEWSPDSQLLLCASFKKSSVQLYSIEDQTWSCKIDEGSAGLLDAFWSSDSRHILTNSDFHLRVSVWSLVAKSVSHIRFIKPIDKPVVFSPCNKYLAVAERRDCRDHISILSSDSWELLQNFIPATRDLAGISWAPDGSMFCVWDNPLQYQVLVYSLDCRCLKSLSPYQWALGVRSVAWSPTGQFLAVGSYDQKVRILNYITWAPIAEHLHSGNYITRRTVVYKEFTQQRNPPFPSFMLDAAQAKYEIIESGPNTAVPSIKVDPSKPNPRMGIAVIKFCSEGRYLATINENMPCVLWLWKIEDMQLCAVLIHSQPIKDISWDTSQTRLAICTGGNKVYIWTPDGALVVPLPTFGEPFDVQSTRWQPGGECLLLVGKDKMCLCQCDNLQQA